MAAGAAAGAGTRFGQMKKRAQGAVQGARGLAGTFSKAAGMGGNQQSAPAAMRKPGAPADATAAGPMQKKPMAMGAAKNGKRRKAMYGAKKEKASYGMPREKALFGKIAGAIGARKRAKAEGKSRKEIRRATVKGALAGGVIGRAAGAIQGFRKNKGKGLRARLAGAASGAVGGFNDLANKGVADNMRERQAERQQRAKDRKAAKNDKKEEKKTRRSPAVPPMTAMAKNGKRKGLKDRRRKKAGGYKIESTESGKMMAATLGVKKNRKKAQTGAARIKRSNRQAAKVKNLENQRKDQSVVADSKVEVFGAGAKTSQQALKAKHKTDKKLEKAQKKQKKSRSRGRTIV